MKTKTDNFTSFLKSFLRRPKRTFWRPKRTKTKKDKTKTDKDQKRQRPKKTKTKGDEAEINFKFFCELCFGEMWGRQKGSRFVDGIYLNCVSIIWPYIRHFWFLITNIFKLHVKINWKFFGEFGEFVQIIFRWIDNSVNWNFCESIFSANRHFRWI